jgi:hypothetical protein
MSVRRRAISFPMKVSLICSRMHDASLDPILNESLALPISKQRQPLLPPKLYSIPMISIQGSKPTFLLFIRSPPCLTPFRFEVFASVVHGYAVPPFKAPPDPKSAIIGAARAPSRVSLVPDVDDGRRLSASENSMRLDPPQRGTPPIL